LPEAVAELIHDGDVVAMEGFTHLIPFAAGHEVIRQRRRDLTLIRMTPDLIYDQLIGAGCAAKLVFSWGGNPGVGSLHRLRDAVEHGWPRPLALKEYTHAAMANAYEAGASNLPFAAFRGQPGSLAGVNPNFRAVTCPFTGEVLTAVPALRPDVAVIHAQAADRRGNVLINGIIGVQKEVVFAAKRSLVTVEEVVDSFDAAQPHSGPNGPVTQEGQPRSHSLGEWRRGWYSNACILPHWTVGAVCVVPGGAFPSYAHGYYARSNAFYRAWDAISRDRDAFQAWLDEHVMAKGPEAFAAYVHQAA
jgi:glutaconate CoA-transferase subunit A